MPFIEFRQQLYPLHKGENRLGSDPQADVRLPELPAGCAVGISVEGDGARVWVAGSGGDVSINGRALGAEPVPLFDGDQITVQGSALLFPFVFVGDPVRPAAEAVAGSPADADAKRAVVEPRRITRVTPPQAERKFVAVLRRLDNNQTYVIEGASFMIGREKRCDVIIPDPSVSRLHAEITLSGGHYLLREHGRTPTKVNDREIHGHHKLRVGDVIRVGAFEFAFLRRPAAAEDVAGAAETTPVRGAVPDAPTVMPARERKRKEMGSRAFQWVLLTLLLILLGMIVFG